jgi:hypothetical protein
LSGKERRLRISLIEKQIAGSSKKSDKHAFLSVKSVGGDDSDDDYGSNDHEVRPELLYEDDVIADKDIVNAPLQAPQVVKSVPQPDVQVAAKSVPQQLPKVVAKSVPLEVQVAQCVPVQVPQVVVRPAPVALKITSTAPALSTYAIRPYVIRKIPTVSEVRKGPAKSAMALLFAKK